MEWAEQLLQVGGAILILVAYIGGQMRRLDPLSWPYLALNFLGSALLAFLAAIGQDWGFLLLEGVWAAVTAWSIAAKLRGARPGPSPHP